MPVGFAKTDSTRRVKFLTGVSYGGVDYGPDYPEQEADVPQNFAWEVVSDGRAVFADEGSDEPEIDETIGRASAKKRHTPRLAGKK